MGYFGERTFPSKVTVFSIFEDELVGSDEWSSTRRDREFFFLPIFNTSYSAETRTVMTTEEVGYSCYRSRTT